MDSSTLTDLTLVLFAAGILIYAIVLYTGLVRLRHENDRAWASIDVLLKQRQDEISNLVEIAEASMPAEQPTLAAVIQTRTVAMNAASISQKALAEWKMATALRGFFAFAENYPQLKANEKFLKLQTRIRELEAQHRRSPRIVQRQSRHLQPPYRPDPRRLRRQLHESQATRLFKVSDEDRKQKSPASVPEMIRTEPET